MKKVIVSSTNPVKINATSNAFTQMFPNEDFEIKGISVNTGVTNQPLTDQETLEGSLNRVSEANKQVPDADYWVGIEGGVELKDGEMEAFAWVIVKAKDTFSKSRTGTFILPSEVSRLIQEGYELGVADDIVFKRSDSKKKNGAVGLLTDNVIDRTRYYEHALILALIPFKNTSYYPTKL